MDLGHASFLAAGLAFGAALAWLALRGQASALAARLAGQEERRGAAEAKREELEQALRAESSRRAGLEATLVEERKSGAEKVALLDDARAKLSDAFKALSSEVLQSSSRSFLELARTSLEKYQEGAKGDLEKRQQAIAELVAPVRESLQKFDARVGGDREGARRVLLRPARAGRGARRDPEGASIRGLEPREGPARAPGARPLGRGPAAAGGRARRDGELLRLHRAGDGLGRGRAAAARRGRPAAGRQERGGGRQGAARGLPRRRGGAGRGDAPAQARRARASR